MALAPALQSFVDAVASTDLPPLRDQPLEELRAGAIAFALAAAGPKADVARVDDRVLHTEVGALPARVYVPRGSTGPRPTVAYFHGGGWVFMGIETHDGVCRRVANAADAIVVSLEYRLAPEHRFPAALDDCLATTRWLSRHGATIGADPSRVAVAGDSAGGNLAAAVALRARDGGGPTLAAQVLVYPALDTACQSTSYEQHAVGYLLTADDMAWFWESYLGPDGDPGDPSVSPLGAPDLSGLPPALIVTAEYDPLRDEGEAYANRLSATGVPAELHRYDGMLHGFLGMDALVPDADEAMRRIGQFLREHLASKARSS